MNRTLAVLAVLALSGCAAAPTLAPGAESVRVTSNPEQVRGLELVTTEQWTIGAVAYESDEVMIRARNFGQAHGAGTVLLTTAAGSRTFVVTVEAYRRP